MSQRKYAVAGLALALFPEDTTYMLKTATIALSVSTLLLALTPRSGKAAVPGQGPEYNSDGQLQLPEHYREWVYLSTGFDMSYTPSMQMGDQHAFDNVFVNPDSYQAFVKTGTWPDHTTLVLEGRKARGKGSINQQGNYQGTVQDLAVHVKDEARFPGKWAFFGFNGGKAGKLIPPSADCYSCHAAHAAVDTTFVQFYPTLLPVATSDGTLSAAYKKETGTSPQK